MTDDTDPSTVYQAPSPNMKLLVVILGAQVSDPVIESVYLQFRTGGAVSVTQSILPSETIKVISKSSQIPAAFSTSGETTAYKMEVDKTEAVTAVSADNMWRIEADSTLSNK